MKNLPMNTTAPELEEVLRNYGTVKPGGVNVKNQKGVCYAFVEFEEVSGAQSAIEVSLRNACGGEEAVGVRRLAVS